MLGKLAPCGGGQPIPLLKPTLLVGRQRTCDVPLGFPNVSSRHCELAMTDGYWFVRDLGSSNGTRVNGTPCESGWLLPNDVLSVASHRFSVEYAPPAGRPPPRAAGGVGARKEGSTPDAASAPVKAAQPTVRTARGPGTAGPSLGKLVPCGGGQPIPLLQPKLIVGRDGSCDVVLRFPSISGRHCQLEWVDGCWLVRDLGSRNGVRVDGEPCESGRLPPGSVLSIASLRYEIAYASAGAAPEPQEKKPLFAQSLLEKAGLARGLPELPPDHREKEDEDDSQGRKYTLQDED